MRKHYFNLIALRKAKTVYSFGLSESIRLIKSAKVQQLVNIRYNCLVMLRYTDNLL